MNRIASSSRKVTAASLWRGARRALAALAAALLLPTLAAAQAGSLIGPLRFADCPWGLLVGDYVGNQVLLVDRDTLQVVSALPIISDPVTLAPGKPLSVGWMNGLLYVGEERTGQIQVFQLVRKGSPKKPKLEWVQKSLSLTDAPVAHPSAIVADESQGLLFVASKVEQAVLVLDAFGTVIRTIGGAGSAAPLVNPQAIALDAAGQRVFVTDDGWVKSGSMGETAFAVVQVYGYDGVPKGRIDGSTGSGNSAYKFARAQGVARDAAGRVYVADSYRHQVLVFAEPSPNAFSAVAILGGRGAGPGELLLPTGVLVDAAASRVFVANTMLSRIEVLATVGVTP